MEQCGPERDVFFLLDGSESILSTDWDLQLEFVAELGSGFMISDNATNALLAEYSTNYLLQTDALVTELSDFERLVLGDGSRGRLAQSVGVTNTASALLAAVDDIARLSRPGVQRVLVLITDGRTSPMNVAQLPQAVEALRAADILTFGIGVGAGQTLPEAMSELLQITGSSERTFAPVAHADLNNIVNTVSEGITALGSCRDVQSECPCMCTTQSTSPSTSASSSPSTSPTSSPTTSATSSPSTTVSTSASTSPSTSATTSPSTSGTTTEGSTTCFCDRSACQETDTKDVVVLVDGSASVNLRTFEAIRSFLVEFLGSLDSRARVALAEFSTTPTLITRGFQNASQVALLVPELASSQGVSFTGTALQFAAQLLQGSPRKRAAKTIVLISDGSVSPSDQEAFDTALSELQETADLSYVVPVGISDENNLRSVVGSNADGFLNLTAPVVSAETFLSTVAEVCLPGILLFVYFFFLSFSCNKQKRIVRSSAIAIYTFLWMGRKAFWTETSSQ